MLRKIRVSLAAISFIVVTLLFLDFSGTIHTYFGWMAKIQFLPALLAINVGVVALLIVATLIFGRLYCSVICPLGIFQDVVSRLGIEAKGKKKFRFYHSKNLVWLRLSLVALLIVALVAGVGSVVALLAPYSSYGRIASNLFAPLWQWGNNLLAHFAERAESYAFYHHEVWIKSIATFVVALITFAVISFLAWRGGRTYCNTICPVGTILGYIAKFSYLKPYIDTEKCNNCGLCERKCKSSCIAPKGAAIDYSRCVTCFNCIESCKRGAIKYGHPKKSAAKVEAPIDESKRKGFMATSLLLATSTLKAQTTGKVDGGYAVIIDKKVPKREQHIVPPGAKSPKNFASKCTGCQLCVSVCPNKVLRPSTDISRLMQPELSYERGYCRPECTRCSEVCPAGAISAISREEKSAIQVGRAVWIKSNCVVVTDNVDCGNCAARCPAGAILMVPIDPNDSSSRKIPSVNAERCVGCGACENLCPAAPFSAIYVEGNNRHITI